MLGLIPSRPLACFFGIEAALDAAAAEFHRGFGVAPRVRASLHAGEVVAGDVGATKREIVCRRQQHPVCRHPQEDDRCNWTAYVSASCRTARVKSLLGSLSRSRIVKWFVFTTGIKLPER